MLVDLSLEDGSGIELARVLRRSRLKTRVIIITGFRDEFSAAEALSVGVHGYILKEQPTADLLGGDRDRGPWRALHLAAHGLAHADRHLARSEDRLLARLSRREREIFRLVVAGSGSKEIASRLFISVKTVDTHRTNINRKLGVRTTASLIRFAAAHGIAIAPRASSGGHRAPRGHPARPGNSDGLREATSADRLGDAIVGLDRANSSCILVGPRQSFMHSRGP